MAKKLEKNAVVPNDAQPKMNGQPFIDYGVPPTQPNQYAAPAEPEDSDEPLHPTPRQELPVPSRTYVDRVWQVEGILQNLENGVFRDASFLCDQILRDERVSAVLDTRVMGLLGLPFVMRPANDSAKAKEIAKLLQGDEQTPGLFDRMMPVSEMAQLLRWSILLGAGLAELRWSTDDMWVPHVKVWHPNVLWWRWDLTKLDSGSYYAQTADEGMIEVRPNDSQWLLHTPNGYRRAWFQGLIRSLGKPYIGRAWTATGDWPRYNELHGIPIRKVIVPAGATSAEKNRFFNQVRNLAVESVLLMPASKDADAKNGEKWDVELLEATADTYKSFSEWLDRVEANISIRVLGHNLSSEVKSGALASAKVSELVRDDIKRWDAKTLAQSIREQVLRQFCQYNYGDPDLAPYPEWQVEPAENLESKGKFYQSLGTSLYQMAQAGAPVDMRAVLEDNNVAVTEADAEPLAIASKKEDPSSEGSSAPATEKGDGQDAGGSPNQQAD